jgi:hypothetical protein
VYNLNYTPTTSWVQSWREITSEGTRTKKVWIALVRLYSVEWQGDRWKGKDLKRSGNGLIGRVSLYWPGGSLDSHVKSESRFEPTLLLIHVYSDFYAYMAAVASWLSGVCVIPHRFVHWLLPMDLEGREVRRSCPALRYGPNIRMELQENHCRL